MLPVWVLLFFCLVNCQSKKTETRQPSFTKLDSLTDEYLQLHDSLLQAWHIMIEDEDQKIATMKILVNELSHEGHSTETLDALQQRISHLHELRYNQHTMAEPDVIEEYDFAINSLITEIISLTESSASYATNERLQKLVAEVKEADERVPLYRSEYDRIATKYNAFIKRNEAFMPEIERQDSTTGKPLFQMNSEEL